MGQRTGASKALIRTHPDQRAEDRGPARFAQGMGNIDPFARFFCNRLFSARETADLLTVGSGSCGLGPVQ
jgi:hypothetical protein